jgi:DNA-binding CsgD family transcriptional regulator
MKRRKTSHIKPGKQYCSNACKYAGKSNLPERQKVAEALVDTGLSMKEIAAKLDTTTRMVKYHASNVYRENGVQDRIQLLAKLVERERTRVASLVRIATNPGRNSPVKRGAIPHRQAEADAKPQRSH